MNQGKLTALAVDRAHRSGKALMLSDVGNLYLRQRASGGASWTLRYTFTGRPRLFKLGRYPHMSLAEARIEARKSRVLVGRNEDPAALRRQAKIELMQRGSFRVLCEDWFQAEVLDRGLQQPSAPRRYLDKYLIPKLGQMAACDIHASDIARILDGMKKRAPAAANDLLRFTRRIFAFGTRRRLVPSNPAARTYWRFDFCWRCVYARVSCSARVGPNSI